MTETHKCIVCGTVYTIGPTSRSMTCSEECHNKLITEIEKKFDKYKKIVDVTTGIAYKVPTRIILENGIDQRQLNTFPVWDEDEKP